MNLGQHYWKNTRKGRFLKNRPVCSWALVAEFSQKVDGVGYYVRLRIACCVKVFIKQSVVLLSSGMVIAVISIYKSDF